MKISNYSVNVMGGKENARWGNQDGLGRLLIKIKIKLI